MWCVRRWRRKLVLSCISVFGFTTLWMFLTLLLLAAQEQFAGEEDGGPSKEGPATAKGVQVVVGHYNGNLPAEEKTKKNLSRETINENNFRPVQGSGENGKAVRLNGEDEILAKDLFQINQFNLVASDRIPLNRTLLDARKKTCRSKTFEIGTLPDTSVVIVFHNEAFSTLARTVTSVINRSPENLLKEIILVDDASDRDFLQAPLEDFVSRQKIKTFVVRSLQRIGLIRARLLGAAKATGQVLTFLDSHCECTRGWLEPLLARIAEDRTVAVCPIIDVINDQTFAYSKGIELFRGGFNWNLAFRWYAVPPRELLRRGSDPTAPIESPTMAGGLFAMNRGYFYEIGSYDDQMDIWGGENLEMSFRIWQCGGRIEILPCSHVGHIFRKSSPHDFPGKKSAIILNTNLARLAEVWMDDWKHLFYKTAPQAKEIAKTVNITGRLALKEKLKCKSFRWYLDNIWLEHFLPMPDEFFGRVKNIGASVCMQLTFVRSLAGLGNLEKRISLEKCTDNFDRFQVRNVATQKCLVSTPGMPGKRRHSLSMKQCTLGNDFWQLWIYSKNFIRGDEHQCLTATEVSSVWIVQLKECTETDKDKWNFNERNRNLVHNLSGLCLGKPHTTGSPGEVHLPTLSRCDVDNETLQWAMLNVDWLPQS